jgi:hypothetical protein
MTLHAIHELSNNSATRLTTSGMHSGLSLTIQNISDEDTVYIGGEGVTSSAFGISLSPAAGISVDLPNGNDSLYAIGEAGGSVISVLTVSLN